MFGNKIKCKSQIALAEGNNLAKSDKALAKMFNAFFANGAATLGIKYEKLPTNYEDNNYNLDELILDTMTIQEYLLLKINAWS